MVLLVGHVGSSIWEPFRRWSDTLTGLPPAEPLDNWSKTVISPIAAAHGATAFFPSDPPWQPFQQWAMRAEGLRASPLGILIHPDYGLWHGYRGALAFRAVPDDFVPSKPVGAHPCDACADRPCMAACPVAAIGEEGFRYQACRGHLARPEGHGCLTQGCLSRNACPVGAEHRYCNGQLQFHMAALKR